MTPDRNKAARELLAFYAEAGVDAAIGEQANDLLSQPEPPPATERPPNAASNVAGDSSSGPARTADLRLSNAPARPAVAAPPAPDAAVMAAREAARSASSLEELRAILDRFDGCGLKGSASRLVFADGTPGSKLPASTSPGTCAANASRIADLPTPGSPVRHSAAGCPPAATFS